MNALHQILVVVETHKHYKHQLTFPGGQKEDSDKTVQDTAIREMKEECGVDLTQPGFTCIGHEDARDASNTRTFVYKTDTTPTTTPDGKEIESCHWYTRDQLLGREIDPADFGIAAENANPPVKINRELHWVLKTNLDWCSDLLDQCTTNNAGSPRSDPSSEPSEPMETDEPTPEPNQTAVTSGPAPEPSHPAPEVQTQTEVMPATTTKSQQTFAEILSVPALEFLLKWTFSKFTSYFDTQPCTTSEDGEEMEAMQQYELMKDFSKDALQHEVQEFNGEDVVKIQREYSPSQASPTSRIFAHGETRSGLALQRLWGKLRAVLTRDLTHDFDMKNAHPTIALYKCKQHFPGQDWWKPLKKYVENRDALFEQLLEHRIPDPKRQVLRAMNSSWLIKTTTCKKRIPLKCKHFHSLDRAFKQLQKELAKLTPYKHFLKGIGNDNKLGKFINKILCHEENLVLQSAMKSVRAGYVVAPMFDGFLGTKNLDPVKTLATLNELPESKARGIVWDQKEHDTEIVVDPSYVGKECFHAATDVALVRRVCEHLAAEKYLVSCRGALWYLNDKEVHVALPQDFRKADLIANRLFNQLQDYELVFSAVLHNGENKTVYAEDSIHELRSFAKTVCGQAIIYDNFEAEYWAGNPHDNYTRGIALWNASVAHLLQKSVFLYEESREVEELKPDELQRNMSARTTITFEQWCASTHHRVYDKDVFVPSLKTDLQNPRHYNRFMGLDIQYTNCKNANIDDTKPLLAHIRNILCKGNDDTYRFLVNTLARILQGVEYGQLEWIKSEVCIIFLSMQGAGKGTLTRHIRCILGRSYASQITKKKELFGNFNDYTSCKLWVEMDELLWAGNNEQAGEFKHMISEDQQTCEGKFKKTREYDSYHNYCATTNNDWAAQVDRDNRRFAPLDCDNKYAGVSTPASRAYFHQLNDPKLGPFTITMALAKYLYELPVNDFVPTLHIPGDTLAMHQQKLQSLSCVEIVAENWLSRVYIIEKTFDGTWGCYDSDFAPLIANHQLWRAAQDNFGRMRGFSESSLKFFQSLTKVLGDTMETSRQGHDNARYKRFAPLSMMKKQFNAHIGFEHFPASDTLRPEPCISICTEKPYCNFCSDKMWAVQR